MKTKLCVVGLALALTASSAWAQDQATIEHRNAQARFDEGLALANKGQYEEARVKFVQAYAVLKAPDVLYNLAVSEKKSAHPVESMRHFRVLVLDPQSPADLVARAKKFMDDLGKVTAHVTVHAPDGADILVDGEVVARAPATQPVDVLSGRRVFSIQLKGNEAKRDISLSDGENTDLTLVFPGAAPTTTNTSPPNASPTTNPAITNSPPSSTPPPASPSAAKYAVGGTLIGLGVVSLVGGFVFGAISSSKHDDLLAQGAMHPCVVLTSAQCTALDDTRNSQNTMNTLSIVSFIAAPVFAAAGVVAILVWPKPREEARARVVPVIGPQSVGLVGSF